MSILVVGGDSVSAITERAYAGGHGCVEHWSGRKTRDLVKVISQEDHGRRGRARSSQPHAGQDCLAWRMGPCLRRAV